LQAGADRSECVRECARAIFLDNDYGKATDLTHPAFALWQSGVGRFSEHNAHERVI